MIKIFNILFILFILFSCSSNTNRIELELVNEIKINIPNGSNFIFTQYFTDNQNEYLVWLDSTNKLTFFNLEKLKTDYSIKLVNFNPKWNYYSIISRDSVIIISNLQNRISAVNNKGEVIGDWKLSTILQEKYSLFAQVDNPIYFIDHRFYCSSIRKDIRLTNQKSFKEYYDSPTNIILAISSDTLKPIKQFGHFPESYYKEKIFNFYDTTPSKTFNLNDKILLSFAKDHFIYIYNLNGEFISKKYSKSTYINHFNEFDNSKINNFLYLRSYIEEEPSYLRIIYDQYQNLYYRLVKHRSHANKGNTELNIANKDYQDFSLIVLDNNLELLDEITLNSNEFYLPGLIPTNKGILIPNTKKSNDSLFYGSIYKVKIK